MNEIKECEWCGNTNPEEIETALFYDSYHQDGGRVQMTNCKDGDACRARHRKAEQINREKMYERLRGLREG